MITDRHRGRSIGYPADWRARFSDAYRLELQAWIDSLVEGTRSSLASAHDALRAGAVAEAVIASMRDGGTTVAVDATAG